MKGENVLTLTQAAANHLAELRKIPELQPDKVIRFVIEDDSVQMKPDQKRPGDVALKHDNKTILILDETVSEALDDLTLDLSQQLGNSQLVFRSSAK
jgi:Fe-S cluster assembly iron-binding protein IscA